MKKLSKKLVRNLTKDYILGKSPTEIAKQYNICIASVFKYTKDIERKKPSKIKGFNKKEISKMIEKRNRDIYFDLPIADINGLKIDRDNKNLLEWIKFYRLSPIKEFFQGKNYDMEYTNYLGVLNSMYYGEVIQKIKISHKDYFWRQDVN